MKSIKLVSFFLLLTFIACEKDFHELGNQLQPDSEKFIVAYNDSTQVHAYTISDDSVTVNNQLINLLGSYHDPIFGTTTANIITQFNLAIANTNFGNADSLTADSIILHLYYDSYYKNFSGIQNDFTTDKSLNQYVNIYELNQGISFDTTYTNDFDVENYYDEADLICRTNLIPDSLKYINIKLPLSFAEHFLFADTSNLTDNESFYNFFKGLYIKADPVVIGGTIYYINLSSTSSRLSLYYTDMADTTSKQYSFLTSVETPKINLFNHEYENSSIKNIDNNIEDTVIYIQAMSGLQSRIEIPGLNSWQDSSDIIINRTELIFTVQEENSYYKEYAVPNRLVLKGINEDDTRQYIPDYIQVNENGSLSYTGESYNSEINGYSFNITSYFQKLIRKEITTKGFYLYSYGSATNARRAVLRSGRNSNPITLKITYSKI
ncbi:MAG: DUF4270 domain-containing protein [Chlorobi bacterium]|nr:DUF4270 domain-containing protein [Chlorobiota bacterium]